MHLHYIYHSCFLLSEEDFLIVYDYWRDPDGLLPKFLEEAEREQKAVYFIVSHFHEDHFNPEIVEWCKARASEDWHLLPSYDTVKRRRIDKALPLAILRFGDTVEHPISSYKYIALLMWESAPWSPSATAPQYFMQGIAITGISPNPTWLTRRI